MFSPLGNSRENEILAEVKMLDKTKQSRKPENPQKTQKKGAQAHKGPQETPSPGVLVSTALYPQHFFT